MSTKNLFMKYVEVDNKKKLTQLIISSSRKELNSVYGNICAVLIISIYKNMFSAVKDLIRNKGVDVNVMCSIGTTIKTSKTDYIELDSDFPLTFAKSYKMIKLLVGQFGANVNSRNKDNSTPLMYLAEIVDEKVLPYLISKGANVNHKDIDGNTALHDAVKRRFDISIDTSNKIIVNLLNNGANPNIKNNDGDTPLHITDKDPEMIKVKTMDLFMRRGANPNLKDAEGDTVLHRKVMEGNLEDNRKHLLVIAKHGKINFKTRNDNGQTFVKSMYQVPNKKKFIKRLTELNEEAIKRKSKLKSVMGRRLNTDIIAPPSKRKEYNPSGVPKTFHIPPGVSRQIASFLYYGNTTKKIREKAKILKIKLTVKRKSSKSKSGFKRVYRSNRVLVKEILLKTK